jgi:hypothetical protein
MSADEPDVDTGAAADSDQRVDYLIEIGQATGLVEGRLAEPPPVGREAGRDDGR